MFRTIGCAVLITMLAGAAHAEGIAWMPVSYPSLIAGSDLIVVGKITAQAEAAHDDGWTACDTITVSEVLKGQVPADGLHLDHPSRHPEAYGGAEADPAPGEVPYEKGQEGVWFLHQEANHHYSAAHPARFKPLPLLSRIKNEIAKAGTN